MGLFDKKYKTSEEFLLDASYPKNHQKCLKFIENTRVKGAPYPGDFTHEKLVVLALKLMLDIQNDEQSAVVYAHYIKDNIIPYILISLDNKKREGDYLHFLPTAYIEKIYDYLYNIGESVDTERSIVAFALTYLWIRDKKLETVYDLPDGNRGYKYFADASKYYDEEAVAKISRKIQGTMQKVENLRTKRKSSDGYVGNYVNDLPHGNGKLYDYDKKKKAIIREHCGVWENGKRQGIFECYIYDEDSKAKLFAYEIYQNDELVETIFVSALKEKGIYTKEDFERAYRLEQAKKKSTAQNRAVKATSTVINTNSTTTVRDARDDEPETEFERKMKAKNEYLRKRNENLDKVLNSGFMKFVDKLLEWGPDGSAEFNAAYEKRKKEEKKRYEAEEWRKNH